jgi:hypothetical protein
MNLPVLTKYQISTEFRKMKKSCEQKSVESTNLSQRLIHGEFRTEASKEAVGAFVLAPVVGRHSYH